MNKLFFSLLAVIMLATPTLISAQSLAEAPITKETPAQIEPMVIAAFSNDTIMIHIAKCESRFRQFTDAGNVFKGSGRYVGVFQIDEVIHTSAALALGFDITTVNGNIGYAKHIFTNEGTRPWKNCASSYQPTVGAPLPPEVLPPVTSSATSTAPIASVLGSGPCPPELSMTQRLRVGDRDGRYSAYQQGTASEVKLLQAHINRILKIRYNQAAGLEDGIFGPKTKLGVERPAAGIERHAPAESTARD